MEKQAGDSHIFSGRDGVFYWFSSKEKVNEGRPVLSCALNLRRVDELLPEEKKLSRAERRAIERLANKAGKKTGKKKA
jgi:hypothetical protein